jgi:pimeloyl-ACP methyl ester carboxylesterase
MMAHGAHSTLDLPDGGHLAYRESGSGPLLVLLHGGGVDHRMWDRQIEPLSRTHRVIALDARGHGSSSTPTGPFRHCDDVAALVEHLDAGPAALVGLSMGGATAVDTALEHPELVSALVVSGTGTSEPTFTDPWALDVFATWERAQAARDAEGWIEAFLRFVPGPQRSADDIDPQVLAECGQMVTDTVATHVPTDPAGGEVGSVPLVPVTDTWGRLPGISVPLLAVVGGLDVSDHIAMAERAAREVPYGEVVTIDGTAHYPNMERPAEFTAAVLRFLGSRAAPGRRQGGHTGAARP